jgi:hypothetical protein
MSIFFDMVLKELNLPLDKINYKKKKEKKKKGGKFKDWDLAIYNWSRISLKKLILVDWLRLWYQLQNGLIPKGMNRCSTTTFTKLIKRGKHNKSPQYKSSK